MPPTPKTFPNSEDDEDLKRKLRLVADASGAHHLGSKPPAPASASITPVVSAATEKPAVAMQPRAVEAPSIRRRDDNGPTITLRGIPRELWRELNLRSVEENTTVRALVLQALRDQGYSVPDDELEDKRKNNGARRS